MPGSAPNRRRLTLSTVRWGGTSGMVRSWMIPTRRPAGPQGARLVQLAGSRCRARARPAGHAPGRRSPRRRCRARRTPAPPARELVQQPQLVDVAGVQDRVAAREGVEDLGPQLTAGLRDVGVGDEAEPQASGAVGRDRSHARHRAESRGRTLPTDTRQRAGRAIDHAPGAALQPVITRRPASS